MKKIFTVIIFFALVLCVLYATGQREDGGLLTISGTNVGSLQISDTTITTIKAGDSINSTNLDWVYANVSNLGINIKGFTDVAVKFRSEYTNSAWWRAVYADKIGIFTEIAYHQKDLYSYIDDIPQMEYGGRYFDGLWIGADYTSGTQLFDKNLNLILNKRIKYIYTVNSTTATNTTYTSWTIVEYSDSEGWSYKGAYLTLYAKWSYPQPKEENVVIIHWGDLAQGIDLSKAIETITVHRGDTGLSVTIPTSKAKVKDEKTGLYKEYSLLGLSPKYDLIQTRGCVCWGINNLEFENHQIPDLTIYDEELECCVWSSSKEYVNLYAVWGAI